MTTIQDKLQPLRDAIDTADQELLDILNKRFDLVKQVAQVKAEANLPALIFPARERDILKQLLEKNAGQFPEAALVHIWRELIGASLSVQGSLKVGLWQVDEQALLLARQTFGSELEIVPYASWHELQPALQQKQIDYAIIPLANETNWWSDLGDACAIATLPFVLDENTLPQAVLLSAKATNDETGLGRLVVGHDEDGVVIATLGDQQLYFVSPDKAFKGECIGFAPAFLFYKGQA